MKVLLREDIAGVGRRGDIVTVADGHARNFLLPKGKAKRATAANLAEFEKRRHELEAAQNAALAAAQAKGAKLDGMALTVSQKAGVDGRLFGSVTNIDIVDALIAQGHEVERAMVRLPQGPLKMIGEYDISVALHSDVVVQIKVTVQGESSQ